MKTVFVIDDDELMREMLTRLLERAGYRVRSFPSPTHVLPLIDSGHPDVIVSDVHMPGMNGLELAQKLREQGIAVPVILITGNLDDGVEREARRLEVDHIFEKPIKDIQQLSVAVGRAISRREEADRATGLDRLRLSFLTGLAHELRTPLTAIKIALDSLFETHGGQGSESETPRGRLLAIGQRNIDRIIRLVEGQLDLLQITLGDVSVARKLVCIGDLIGHVAGETSPAVRRCLDCGEEADEERVFFFTDPDRLRAVIRYVLENGSCRHADPVRVRFAIHGDTEQVRIRFENARVPEVAGEAMDPVAGRKIGHDFISAIDDCFETRAFRQIVASLSGEIRTDSDMGRDCVTLSFPLRPRFDARDDLIVPINRLREAAMLTGKSVSVLKCDVSAQDKNGSCFSPQERAFFARCSSTLSDGDALLRGPGDDRYYLVLIERDPGELDQFVRSLRTCADTEFGTVDTTILPTLPAEIGHADAALFDLETVQ